MRQESVSKSLTGSAPLGCRNAMAPPTPHDARPTRRQGTGVHYARRRRGHGAHVFRSAKTSAGASSTSRCASGQPRSPSAACCQTYHSKLRLSAPSTESPSSGRSSRGCIFLSEGGGLLYQVPSRKRQTLRHGHRSGSEVRGVEPREVIRISAHAGALVRIRILPAAVVGIYSVCLGAQGATV